MDRRKKLLLNTWEAATDIALRRVEQDAGVRVVIKPRLGSVLDLDRSGLTNEEFWYATKAELDFAVINPQSTVAEFAVEFDGPHHLTDPKTMQRDRMKDSICERLGLLLLRIDADFLQQRGQTPLVAWLVQAWWMERKFYELQAQGEIDPAEPYFYSSWMDTNDQGRVTGWFSLDGDARAEMARALQDGVADVPDAETLTSGFDSPFIEAISLFPLRAQRSLVVGRARLKNFGTFGGVRAWQLVTDLALADAGDKLRLFRRGDHVPVSAEQLPSLRARTRGWVRQGCLLSDAPQ